MLEHAASVKKLLKNPIIVLFVSLSLLLVCQLYGALAAELVASSLDDATRLVITSFVALIVLIALLGAVRKALGVHLATFGLKKPSRRWILATVGGGVVYIVIASALIVVVTLLVKSFQADQAQNVGLDSLVGTSQYVYSFIALALLTPVFEEIIFRGILFKGLRNRLPVWVAIGISSGMFALAHGQWNVALDTFVFGIVLSSLVEYSESIWPAILLHVAKNSFAFTLLFVLS